MNDVWLAHHGIIGQRWGIRRFQNKDGSLTPAGRKRYLNSDGSLNRRGEKELEKSLGKSRNSLQNELHNIWIENDKKQHPELYKNGKPILKDQEDNHNEPSKEEIAKYKKKFPEMFEGVNEDDPEEVMLAVEDSKRYEKSQNKLKKEHKPDFSKMSYKEEKKYAKEQSVKMLKDFRKIYDDYMNYHGDDDDTEYEKFYSKYNTLCKDFEKQTGYEIIGHSSGRHNSIQFGRKTKNGYQEWIIHEDDYEPDGYWLEDPDKDW